ncbi:MAG TPA: response regulator [Longimicrobiales bacterium]|nr:response regulator [Longimicrobiales bacterium]
MARIFVVDDEPSVRGAIVRILQVDGHEVEPLPDGRAALSELRTTRPDLIVTDLFMPEVDGQELLVELDRIAPEIPVIAISGASTGGDDSPLKRALHLGAAATIEKPFRVDEVRRTVDRVLASSAAETSAVERAAGERSLEADIRGARILVADDDEPVRRALTRMLERGGYGQIRVVATGTEAVRVTVEWDPDLVILDLHMPGTDGFGVLEYLREAAEGPPGTPVLVLTGDIDPNAKRQAFEAGAMDFVTKPPNTDEALARIHNLLSTRILHRRLAAERDNLEIRVHHRTRDVELAHFEVVDRLAMVAEYRDDLTGAHQRRVGEVAALIARRLDYPSRDIRILRMAAPLHDIGKVAIPDSILRKPGKLDAEEWEVMKTHTTVGADMLSGGDFSLLQAARKIALSHHERWDGEGYPNGSAGDAISIEGRITAIADVLDCMTHSRPYRDAWPIEEAMAEIDRCAGTQFDPALAAVILRAWEDGEVAPILKAELDPEHPGA